MKPSTKALAREGRKTRDYSFLDLLYGYVYARWPYLYIGVATRRTSGGKGSYPVLLEVFRY
ncbi:MAG: hypothetical protein WBG01_03720 [Bacteroidota bacterium]